MGKWSIQQELNREERERAKSRKESLSKFCYDLAKLVFAGMVIVGLLPLYGNPFDVGSWAMVFTGFVTTCILAALADKILK